MFIHADSEDSGQPGHFVGFVVRICQILIELAL